MTPGLTDFLQDRLDEDEAAARMAQTVQADGWYEVAQQAIACTDTVEIGPAYQHIARHDPARVFREVKAKRAILRAEMDRALGGVLGYSSVLLDLASIYSDHPDYRQEWKP